MRSKLIKRPISLFIAAVLMGFFLEGLVRIFSPQNILPNYNSPAFGIPNSLRPNYNVEVVSHGNFPPYSILTSANHLRSSRSYEYQKPEDVYRVLCLGDSVFFGYGVNNDETFSHFLEKILNENFPKKNFEVINAAVPGWGLIEYTAYLEREGKKFNPDLVIVTSFPDDFRQNFDKNLEFEKIYRIGPKIFLETGNIVFPKTPGWLDVFIELQKLPFYEWLNRNSQLFYRMRVRLNQIELLQRKTVHQRISLHDFIEKFPYKGYDKVIWSFDGLEKQLPFIERNPAQFYVKSGESSLLQGQANTILYFYVFNRLQKMVSDIGAEFLVLQLPTQAEVLKIERVPQKLSEFNNQNNIYWLDLLPSLKQFQTSFSTPIYFSRDNHWTPAGHLLISKIIFNFLIKNSFFKEIKTDLKNKTFSIQSEARNIQLANSRIADFLESSGIARFNEGIRLKNLSRFNEAEQVLMKYLADYPEDDEAHFQIGMLSLLGKNYTLAEVHFKKALSISKGRNARHSLYLAYSKVFGEVWKNINAGDIQIAKKQLNNIKKMNFYTIPKFYNMLALAYLKLGDFARANKFRLKYMQYQPDIQERLINFGGLPFPNVKNTAK